MPVFRTSPTGEPLVTKLISDPAIEQPRNVAPTEQQVAPNVVDFSQSLTDFADYNKCKDYANIIQKRMDNKQSEAKSNRELRYGLVDIEAERKAGNLAPDEVYITEHLTDTNIRREQSKYVAYVTGSRRACIFQCIEQPSMDTSLLDTDFTLRLRYDGWQLPIYRATDGMQLHGVGFVEVVSDKNKPGFFAYEDIPSGTLGFTGDMRNIQACECLLREFYYTKTQLVGLGFDPLETKKLIDAHPDTKDTALIAVTRVYFRKDGFVNAAWAEFKKCDKWLRDPRPLHIGVMKPTLDAQGAIIGWENEFETSYPIVPMPYLISEDTVIENARGRAFLDESDQEALTSLMSSTLTGFRRAAGFYFKRKTDTPSTTTTSVKANFTRDGVIESDMEQFQLKAPEASIFNAISTLRTKNAQEQSQINYTALTRKDSEKTATEVNAAQQEAAQLSAAQIALYSAAFRELYGICWRIYSTNAAAGHIKTMVDKQYFVAFTYIIKSAGDTDVVERQEKIMRMMQAWPVVQNSPIADEFLKRLISLMFPEDADIYAAIFDQGNKPLQLLTAVVPVLAALALDPATGQPEPALGPEGQQVAQLIQAITMYLEMIQQKTQQPRRVQPTPQDRPAKPPGQAQLSTGQAASSTPAPAQLQGAA